jgi:hypothetical protein
VISTRAKIIITGTGRAGTTFLVQLLTELGLDTGYTPGSWQRDYDVHCAAGLEQDILGEDSPRVVKNPALCETLPGLLARGEIVVEHALVPVRALDEAARSRIWIGGKGRTPGGLWGTTDPAQQKAVLAENFHRLVHTLVQYDVPHTFLSFPRLVADVNYTRRKLSPVLGGIDRLTFEAAFARVARPELVHNFSVGVPDEAGAPARAYARQRRLRWWRGHGWRVFGWTTIVLITGIAVSRMLS